MDGRLILEFQTRTEAENALSVINEVAAMWWQSQGYTVLNGSELVGKTGEIDQPDACRTTTWAEVQESPEGTFYFTSLTPDPRFWEWRKYLPEGAVMPEDKEMPESWLANS